MKPQRGSARRRATETLATAWAAFEADGREFWPQMDALVEMLDGVVAEEARDA